MPDRTQRHPESALKLLTEPGRPNDPLNQQTMSASILVLKNVHSDGIIHERKHGHAIRNAKDRVRARTARNSV